MDSRIDRTLKNWRWWVGLPVFAALVPVVVLDLALCMASWTARQSEDWAEAGRSVLSRALKPILNRFKAWLWPRPTPSPEGPERT